jgi:hypothetical protein
MKKKYTIAGICVVIFLCSILLFISCDELMGREPSREGDIWRTRNGHCEVALIGGKEYIVCSNLRGVAVCPR